MLWTTERRIPLNPIGKKVGLPEPNFLPVGFKRIRLSVVLGLPESVTAESMDML